MTMMISKMMTTMMINLPRMMTIKVKRRVRKEVRRMKLLVKTNKSVSNSDLSESHIN